MTHNLYLFTQTSYRLLNFYFDRLNTTPFSDKERRDKLRLLFDRSVYLHDKYSRLFQGSDLAVVATSSPDSAILDNAVVETVQGTTNFYSGKNESLICESDSYQSILDLIPLSAYADDYQDDCVIFYQDFAPLSKFYKKSYSSLLDAVGG